jgi:transposase InsO family protein
MNVHKNARTTPRGREWIVSQAASGQSPKGVGDAVGVCPRTVRKWLKRHHDEGVAGLQDRSSRPKRLYRPTPQPVVERIEALRRQRLTGKAIAAETGVSPATVSRILRRLGLNKLSALEPSEPVRRYERKRPGELIHIDIKKLGRFAKIGHRMSGNRQSKSYAVGWEYVHVCIDDNSRVAFTQIKPDEKKQSAVAFLKASFAYYTKLGVKVERVMTDNGSCYRPRDFAQVCEQWGLRHIRTKPYTPKTNGKAERFIQTALREWAYAHVYNTSDQRAAELPYWMHRCNGHRPHGSIGAKPPISRLALNGNNLLRLHS